jgi:hypothetical protein
MAGTIDMMGGDTPTSQSPQSTIPSGGGGMIDMLGNPGVSLSQTPVSSVQAGKGSGGIDMAGEEGLLGKNASATFGARFPSDKGE